MRSPGQFEHALIRRAKAGIAEAALTNGLAPTHGLTLDLKKYRTGLFRRQPHTQ